MASDPSSLRVGYLLPFASPDALVEPEKLLAAYFRSSSVGLCVLDANLRYLAVNEALAEMNGVPASNHLGKTVHEVLGEFADSVEPHFRSVLTTGEPAHFEISATLATKKEAAHWIVHYLPIQDGSGMVTRIGVLVVEITAQKRLEQSLKELGGNLRKGMDRLQMLLDVSSVTASNSNLDKIFPQISARIRRVLRHEYAGFELHDPSSGLLVRQVEDFPLGKGLLSSLPISPDNSPGGRSLRERAPLIFSRNEMETFAAEITKNFLAEGLESLCCVPLLRPKGPLGVLVLGSTRKNAFQVEDLVLLSQVAASWLWPSKTAVPLSRSKNSRTALLRRRATWKVRFGRRACSKRLLATAKHSRERWTRWQRSLRAMPLSWSWGRLARVRS